ncbi:MAG TPA: hypothetical protein VFY82_03275 [Acidimicrobiales bacterium]|nr:hypothetical protein [Acidimicrobiales bacterium]
MTQSSDAELLARLRSGDGAAFALLRERRAATAAGRPAEGSTPDDPASPDTMPAGSRGEPADGVDRAADAVVLDAYAALSDRVRAVLWLTEVEGHHPAAVGHLLGTTPAAAAALASRAREQLRLASLRAHLDASPRPRCGRPPGSRLAGYLHDGPGDGIRTATVIHVEGCSSCQSLVAAAADAPRLFAGALAPWSSPIAAAATALPAAAAPAPRTGRPVRALVRAGRYGSNALAMARRDAALVSTIAVAAALVVAVLASAFLPARRPADLTSSDPVPAVGDAIVPARPSSPASDTTPSTSMPIAAPVRPADPSAVGPPGTTAPVPDRTAVDAPEPSPATVPPPTPPAADAASATASAAPAPPPPPTTPSPAQPAMPPDLLHGSLAAASDGDPGLGAAAVASVPSFSMATVPPLTVIEPGQSATVEVGAVGSLRLSCPTPSLGPTVTVLD